MVCLHICLCLMCEPGALVNQKKVSDPLGLKLQNVELPFKFWELDTGPL